nr:hypothetical protein [Niallia sp.]
MRRKQAQSSFKLTEANEIPYSEVTEGPKLTKGMFVMEYNGELQGKGELQELKCYLTDNLPPFMVLNVLQVGLAINPEALYWSTLGSMKMVCSLPIELLCMVLEQEN